MDPISAFQIAAGAFQLAGFLINVTSTASGIYKSTTGLDNEKAALSNETDRIDSAASSVSDNLNLIRSCGQLDKDQRRLEVVVQECIHLSSKLRDELETFKLGALRRKRNLPKKALLAVIRKDGLRDLKEKLQSIQQELQTELLVNLWRKVDLSQQHQREALCKLDTVAIQQAQSYAEAGSKLDDIFSELQGARNDNLGEHQKTQRLIKDVHDLTLDRNRLEKFKQSLSFEYVDSRQQLREAFPGTCKWIWKSPQDSKDSVLWDDFPKWIEDSSGVYWIQGKAGTGKSTLMHYISRQKRLENSLRTWANGKRLITPTFFFWRAGSTEQKTIHGLLRSFISQILQKGPDSLVQSLAPFMNPHGNDNATYSFQFQPRWHLKTLIDILQAIMTEAGDAYRFCILVDGVDEFEGDPEDQQQLLDILVGLSRSSNTKMCVSSRPEPHLIEAFYGFPTLRLQDLNKNDILGYVEGTLKKTTRMQYLNEQNHESCRDLIVHLCNKAEGVFLWAHFAVGDILRGLWAMESLKQLHSRLSRLDRSLEGVFRRLLADLNDPHKDELAFWLGLLMRIEDLHAGIPTTPFVALASKAGRFSELSSICLEGDNEKFSGVPDLWHDELMTFSSIVKARSAGFLDLSSERNQMKIPWWNEPRGLSEVAPLRIDLVHRSVRDFLFQDQTAQNELGARIPNLAHLDTSLFEASCAMHALCVRRLITSLSEAGMDVATFRDHIGGSLNNASDRHFEHCMNILLALQKSHGIGEHLKAAVSRLENCISNLDASNLSSYSDLTSISYRISPTQLMRLEGSRNEAILPVCAAKTGLFSVLPQLLGKFSISEISSVSTLCLIFCSKGCQDNIMARKRLSQTVKPQLRTLVYLLASAADPNQVPQSWPYVSAWSSYLRWFGDNMFYLMDLDATVRKRILSVAKLFIEAGADLTAVVDAGRPMGQGPVFTCRFSARFVFDRWLPFALEHDEVRMFKDIPWQEEPVIFSLTSFSLTSRRWAFGLQPNDPRKTSAKVQTWNNKDLLTQREVQDFTSHTLRTLKAYAQNEMDPAGKVVGTEDLLLCMYGMAEKHPDGLETPDRDEGVPSTFQGNYATTYGSQLHAFYNSYATAFYLGHPKKAQAPQKISIATQSSQQL